LAGAHYDDIGRGYVRTRRPDRRIQNQLWDAIGAGSTVVNVGAGTGSYEPPSTVLAVEPSPVMITQRPPGAAPAVQASAESIPLPDDAVDVALAVLTIHHWADLEAGFSEMRRVACRLVVLTWDPSRGADFWLVRDYLPESAELDRDRFPTIERVAALVGTGASVEPVPVPHDCADGFFCAYWRRPERYLDPSVRSGMSNVTLLGDRVGPPLDRLRADLESGWWHRRNRDILDRREIDLGYRIVSSPPNEAARLCCFNTKHLG
jgi:SAM-dependent methyltransferase